MGLGLHGGGLAVAEYCTKMGAEVTVTDLRSKEELRPSLEKLQGHDICYVLGQHEEKDFIDTDIVIKNPAVRRDSPWLKTAIEHDTLIETDISIFLTILYDLNLEQTRLNSKAKPTLVTVTGTKGKSSTCNFMHQILQHADGGFTSYLGGNITTSPLLFFEDISQKMSTHEDVYIILELSSFQIGDLRMVLESRKKHGYSTEMQWPDCALITNVLPDHQDYYPDMETYVADKAYLFENMPDESLRIIGYVGEWAEPFLKRGKLIEEYLKHRNFLPLTSRISGKHQRDNLSMGIFLLRFLGVTMDQINIGIGNFTPLKHRLQYIGSCLEKRVKIINDSASTIPDACLQAVEAFENIYLICGGTDKNLNLDLMLEAGRKCKALYLLQGSASTKLAKLFNSKKLAFSAIFEDMNSAVNAAYEDIVQNKEAEAVLLLSPGSASFEMFQNEFDRGDQFITAASDLPGFLP